MIAHEWWAEQAARWAGVDGCLRNRPMLLEDRTGARPATLDGFPRELRARHYRPPYKLSV